MLSPFGLNLGKMQFSPKNIIAGALLWRSNAGIHCAGWLKKASKNLQLFHGFLHIKLWQNWGRQLSQEQLSLPLKRWGTPDWFEFSMGCPSRIFAHDLTGSYTRPGPPLLRIHLFISRCAIGWNGIRWQEHFLGVREVVHLPSGIGSLSYWVVGFKTSCRSHSYQKLNASEVEAIAIQGVSL